ncbi:uncharacterized protein STEHIDRAFT_163348 [Stereum hirsutum FP-91666 SS1]|uniref:Uncharacterized protein n=1 Tax=Stereum hirsutum (strain FP-91666) TaxID=721885 RepID=R7RWT9_STEHR|nr:uncharacterized protein STEHIDRAFT_163348 [Stereum hirsutum FP-91666 SS1]EIM79789.1 hypothetical protein STEHIDRAFT_163348 [Stereum hirsutum FP-91666 SS1]
MEAQEWYCDNDLFATEERMRMMEYRVERFEEEDWEEDLGEGKDDYEILIGHEELDEGSEGMGFVQGLGNEELEDWEYEESGMLVVESLLSSWPPLLPSTPSIARLNIHASTINVITVVGNSAIIAVVNIYSNPSTPLQSNRLLIQLHKMAGPAPFRTWHHM